MIAVLSIVTSIALAACDPAPAATEDPSGPRTIDVCADGCAFIQLAPALMGASDGDTIMLEAGTYEGGVVIDASVSLTGAGPNETVIEGGGPVVTIGGYGSGTPPTVTIEGVTITGGVTRSWAGAASGDTPGVDARGGGILATVGTEVALRDVVITGNRVAPSDSIDSGLGEVDGVPIAYAGATGGGIDTSGDLTLERTIVSGNLVGAAADLSDPGMASDAQGGGILSHQGDLTIIDSQIIDNVASATAPNGRFGEGGGILQEAGSLTITDSSVSGNTARLDAAFPAEVDMLGQPGGIFIGDRVDQATITGTRIVGNAAIMTNSVGDAEAFSGGLNMSDAVDLTIEGSVIARNIASASTVGRSAGDAEADTGGAALLGTVKDTTIEDNKVIAISARGDATAAIGGVLIFGTLEGSRVQHNTVRAVALEGSASVFGGGLMVAWEPLTIRDTLVARNVAQAEGRNGWVRGGGIYGGANPFDIPAKPLELVDSSIIENRLIGDGVVIREGGGIYVRGGRLSSTNTDVRHNAPDDCVGCP